MNGVIILTDEIILNYVLHSVAVDVTKREEMMKIVRSSISTKFIKKWCVCVTVNKCSYSEDLGTRGVKFSCRFRADLACGMALDAVQMVAEETGERKEIDIKRYAKTEKVSLIITCATVSVAPTTSVDMVVCRYLEGR